MNEILGRVISTHWVTLDLSAKQLFELIYLLEISGSQRTISIKKL